MVNCTNSMLRVLPLLGVNVGTWDAIISYKLRSKLDRATYKKWLEEIKLRQNVPLKELITFLEEQANDNLPPEDPPQQQQKRDQRRNDRSRKQGGAAVLTTVTKSTPQSNQKIGGETKPAIQHK